MRTVLFRVLLVCFVLAGATLYVESDPVFRSILPQPIQGFFHHLGTVLRSDPPDESVVVTDEEGSEKATSNPAPSDESQLPEHDTPLDAAPAHNPENEQNADDEPEEKEDGPVVYEENPRYRVERVSDTEERFTSEVQTGDTAGEILGAWLDPNAKEAALTASKSAHPLTKIRVGQPFSITRNPQTKQFMVFRYEIDKEKIVAIRAEENGKFSAAIEKIEYTVRLERLRGVIKTSLSDSIVEMNEQMGLALALADIFGSEINFITDLRVDDTFEVLVEKRYREDILQGYGKVIGAKFTNQGKLHASYLFHNEQGRPAYYDAKGENLHRALLKAPLSFLRVTSKYTMTRRHPVFGNVRPHQGIDYGAPSGTPIMAVGDGVIAQIGYAGGYGKQIILRHPNGLESLYGHMSRFAKGMSAGKRVRQGQTIGYVGSTGVATGPHLDFRIKRGGKFVNPSKLVVPRDRAIERKRMREFKATIAAIDAYWNGKSLDSYDPDAGFDR